MVFHIVAKRNLFLSFVLQLVTKYLQKVKVYSKTGQSLKTLVSAFA